MVRYGGPDHMITLISEHATDGYTHDADINASLRGNPSEDTRCFSSCTVML